MLPELLSVPITSSAWGGVMVWPPPAMLQRRSRKEARRENQRRYEARQRDAIGLFPVPLTNARSTS